MAIENPISWTGLCAEFGLDPATAVFPTDFFGLGGAPSAVPLGFQDFLGRSGSPISVSSMAVASGTATRTITVPDFQIGDTAIVFISLRGSATTVNTSSTGWRRIGAAASSGTTLATTMAVFACENTTVANQPLALSSAGTNPHVQTVYIIRGGGLLDDSKDSPPNGAASQNPGQTSLLTASTSWLVIAAVSCGVSAVTGGPAGFTFNADSWEADASQYAMLTAFQELEGTGTTVDPAPFGVTQSSSRAVGATLALNLDQGSAAPATYNLAAGAISDDNQADPSVTARKTITSSKPVTWTYTITSGAATCNRANGYSGTSIRFDLASTSVQTTSTVDITATDGNGNVTNWTLTLTAYALAPAPTFSLAPGTYTYNDTDANGYTSIGFTASSAVTWTWTRTAGVASGSNTVSPASGTSGTTYTQTTSEVYGSPYYQSNSQTISLTASWAGGSATWTITTNAMGVTYTGGEVGVGGVAFPEL